MKNSFARLLLVVSFSAGAWGADAYESENKVSVRANSFFQQIQASYPFVSSPNAKGCFALDTQRLCGEICFRLEGNEFKYSFTPKERRSDNPAGFSMVRGPETVKYYDRVLDYDFNVTVIASSIPYRFIRAVDVALQDCRDAKIKPVPKPPLSLAQEYNENNIDEGELD